MPGGEVVGEALILLRAVDQGVESQIKRSVEGAVQKTNATVKVKADTNEAESKIKGLGSSFASFGDYLQTKLNAIAGPNNPVSKLIGEFQKMGLEANAAFTGAAGGALALAGVLGALTIKGIGEFSKMTAEVRKLKAASGESAEEASRLAGVARGLGVDVNTVADSFFKASRQIEINEDKLRSHGVEVVRDKAGHLDLGQTLLSLSDAYHATGNAADRNRLLQDALGRSGAALRPIIAANREEVERLAAHAPMFSDADLKAGRDFAIAQREAGEAVKELEVDLARGIIPALTEYSHGLASVVSWLDEHTKRAGGSAGLVKSFVNAVIPLGPLLDHVGRGGKDAAKGQAEAADALQETAEKAKAASDALEQLAQGQERLIDLTLGLTDSQYGLERAQLNVEDRTKALNEAIAEHGAGSLEAREADLALRDAQHGVLQSSVGLAKQLADQEYQQRLTNGETLKGADHANIYKGRLLEVAATVEEPLRSQIQALAGDIYAVPTDHNTTFTADASDVFYKISLIKGSLQELAAGTFGAIPISGSDIQVRQHGGRFAAGQTLLVGEARPELVVFDRPGVVLPDVPAALDRLGGGGGVVVNMTNNWPAGTNRADVEAGIAAAAPALVRVLERVAAGAGTRG